MTDLKVECAKECPTTELVRAHGSPLYVYSLSRLRHRVAEFQRALEGAGATLLFATMANDRPEILESLAALGVGACVNSLPHLELARRSGFTDDLIQFTSSGIRREDMATLVADGIRTNLDSLMQLESWLALGGQTAGIRVNAGSLRGDARWDRLGIPADGVVEAIALARRAHARIVGLHVYAGTNFQDAVQLLTTIEPFLALAEALPDLEYVNVGGGVGVSYGHEGLDFDVNFYGSRLAQLLTALRGRTGRPIRCFFEPGRGLAAPCGTFATTVTDTKRLGNARYVAVDASVSQFPRPFHHPDSPHRIRRLGSSEEDAAIRCTVVGRTTFSRDVLGEVVVGHDLSPGDILVFDDAGAYCESMMSRFLGQPAVMSVVTD